MKNDYYEFKLESAECVTESTLLGIDCSEYPVSHGNCFSVKIKDGEHFRIVNFNHENLEEILRRGVSFPISIHPLDGGTAAIHDERIPDAWYDQKWCEICCPTSLLPLPQRLSRDRQEKQGARVKQHGCIILKPCNKPVL